MEKILIVIITILSVVTVIQGAAIALLIQSRKDFANKIKRKYSCNIVQRKEKGYISKISNLYADVERLERQLHLYKAEMKVWKQKTNIYASEMKQVTLLYSKSCETISNYLREGLLIKSFSDSHVAYEQFKLTWQSLQDRNIVEVFKFQDLLDDSDDLEYLFGTADMQYLSKVFQVL